MKAEDVEVGMQVVGHMGMGARTILTNVWESNGQQFVVLGSGGDDWGYCCINNLKPAPQPEYCAVYIDISGAPSSYGKWLTVRANPENHSHLLGHFVRDTPDSTPRWEPA